MNNMSTDLAFCTTIPISSKWKHETNGRTDRQTKCNA